MRVCVTMCACVWVCVCVCVCVTVYVVCVCVCVCICVWCDCVCVYVVACNQRPPLHSILHSLAAMVLVWYWFGTGFPNKHTGQPPRTILHSQVLTRQVKR